MVDASFSDLSWSPVNYTVDEHGGLQELLRTLVEKILVR